MEWIVEPEKEERPKTGAWRQMFRAKVHRYLALLLRYWWLLALTTSAGLVIGAWKIASQPAVFVSSARMMVSGKINFTEGATYSEEMNFFMSTQRELMQDEAVRQRAEARVRTQYPETPVSPVMLTASPLPQTSIFILTAVGSEPRYPQKFLDAVMEEFIATRHEMRSEKSESAEGAISDEIEREQAELRKEEDKLLDFQRENNIGYLEQEGNSAGAYLAKLNTQLADLKKEAQLLDLFELDQEVARKSGRLPKSADPGSDQDGTSESRPGDERGPELEYLRAKQQIELLRAERSAYAKDLRPNHPIMIDFDQQIAQQQQLVDTFRKQSADNLQHRRDAAKLEIRNLETTVKEWESKALASSQRLAEYNGIRSMITRERTQLESLSRSKGSVEINRNVDQEVVSIRQRASVAREDRPGAAQTLALSVGLGLAAGLAALLVADRLDDRVVSFAEFGGQFQERVLAQISSVRQRGKTELERLRGDDRRHAFAESFRSLRSSLVFLKVDGTSPKVLLITSAVPNEGKSTVSVNLAVTLALSGARVLLVDGDMRRGQIHRSFGLPNERGLSELLSGECALHSVTQATDLDGLSLLSRGRSVANPGELYLGLDTDRFLKGARAKFDYVVIDSSPVMVADDTASLAPKTEATLFVFRFTSSHTRISRKALDLLRERHAKVIGVVCNDVSEAMQEYQYHRYPEYYGAAARQV